MGNLILTFQDCLNPLLLEPSLWILEICLTPNHHFVQLSNPTWRLFHLKWWNSRASDSKLWSWTLFRTGRQRNQRSWLSRERQALHRLFHERHTFAMKLELESCERRQIAKKRISQKMGKISNFTGSFKPIWLSHICKYMQKKLNAKRFVFSRCKSIVSPYLHPKP